MNDDIHERVARKLESVYDSLLTPTEVRLRITEILRREYGGLEVIVANRNLALRLHSDNIKSLKAKLAKAREALEFYGDIDNEGKLIITDRYEDTAREALKEIGDE